MGAYDERDKGAHGPLDGNPLYSKNQHILKWWTPAHDRVMAERIARKQWVWYLGIVDEIVEVTPAREIEEWNKSDPLCSQYAWYNVLMNFAHSRAGQLGLTKKIRPPEWKTCPLCNQRFIENSLPYPLVKRLGLDNLDFCAPCLRDTVLQGTGNNAASQEDILQYLRDLATLIERVPPQGFGEGVTDLHKIDPKKRTALLRLFQRKPTVNRVKVVFGSWRNALVEAGVSRNKIRKSSRSVRINRS